MNIKEIKNLKKQFIKTENLIIKSVYVKAKGFNAEVLFKNNINIFSLSEEDCKMYLKTFGKLFSTKLDSKLFDLEIDKNIDNNIKTILTNDNLNEVIDAFLERFIKNYQYDYDVIVNFVRTELQAGDYGIKTFTIISINKVELVKPRIAINTKEEIVQAETTIDYSMNLNPLEGIIYPAYANTNNLLYYQKSKKELNKETVSDLYNVIFTSIDDEEKADFIKLIKDTCGQELSLNKIKNIYESINSKIDKEDIEESKINTKEIKTILEKENIDISKYDEIVETLNNKIFKISNIISNKEISIISDGIKIITSKEKLEKLKTVDGKILLDLNTFSFDNIPINKS